MQKSFGPLILAFILFSGTALGGSTGAPDPNRGKSLAISLCSNCHLIDPVGQEQVNVDVPTFPEIANKVDQSSGAIMAAIMLPKHPMPQIPLTKNELADLAAYILSLRTKEGERR